MTPNDRCRAGWAVAERMHELGLTMTQLAERAHVDRATVRAVIRGTRSAHDDTRARIDAALDWPPDSRLTGVATTELVRELCRRLGA